jgi:hypothetical protein
MVDLYRFTIALPTLERYNPQETQLQQGLRRCFFPSTLHLSGRLRRRLPHARHQTHPSHAGHAQQSGISPEPEARHLEAQALEPSQLQLGQGT